MNLLHKMWEEPEGTAGAIKMLKVELDMEEHLQETTLSDPNRSVCVQSEGRKKNKLLYGLDDPPPWFLCLFLGFQNFLMMTGGTISLTMVLAPKLCIQHPTSGVADELAKADIMATILFTSGIVTFLQTTFGCRLPIVQGGSFAFLPPTFAILSTFGTCPELLSAGTNLTSHVTDYPNSTAWVVAGSPEHTHIWTARMRAVQGAIIVSSVLEILIGFTGAVGFLMRFIGPLVITPTVTLIGLSLFQTVASKASVHWGISGLTMGLLVLFSEYLKGVKFPYFVYSSVDRRWTKRSGYPLFRMFPVILAMFISYIICMILTYTDVFPNDPLHNSYHARTDSRVTAMYDAHWFRIPYPGQWGLPAVTAAGVVGMQAGVLCSILESIGDYYVAARMAGAPPPTPAAVNRGIFCEGIGCMIAGVFGSGNGTTSHSGNIAAIGITRVGSRRVIQAAACLMLVFGTISKFSAVFVTIPEPIVGGVYVMLFGMVTAVGLSNLQFVDLNSSRNLFILGISLLLGLAIPDWIQRNAHTINTGSTTVNEIIVVLLSTGMFIGGAVGFLLDNTIAGTPEERGILAWRQKLSTELDPSAGDQLKSYDLPFGNVALTRCRWTRYVPVCPNFLHGASS